MIELDGLSLWDFSFGILAYVAGLEVTVSFKQDLRLTETWVRVLRHGIHSHPHSLVLLSHFRI